MPALPGLMEGELRTEHLRHALEEGELLPFEKFLRAVLTIELCKLRFVVEKFELARGSGHVQVDHPFRLRCEVREIRQKRVGRILVKRSTLPLRGEPHAAETDRAILEEMPTREVSGAFVAELLEEVHHVESGISPQRFSAMSEFKSVFATSTIAASSGVAPSFADSLGVCS